MRALTAGSRHDFGAVNRRRFADPALYDQVRSFWAATDVMQSGIFHRRPISAGILRILLSGPKINSTNTGFLSTEPSGCGAKVSIPISLGVPSEPSCRRSDALAGFIGANEQIILRPMANRPAGRSNAG